MFDEVPGSCCGTSSSSSESMGLCFFAFGKSLGFFTSAVVFFPFCLCELSFPCGDLERSLTRPCGSTAADSSSADGGTCTGARSRDPDLGCLPEPPGSSSGSVAGSWMTMGWIGGTGGVCDACSYGCTPSRDLDRCRCLSFCGD